MVYSFLQNKSTILHFHNIMSCESYMSQNCHENSAIPVFFFVYRQMRFLILGRSVELKKKTLKKITRSLRIVGPGTPGRR